MSTETKSSQIVDLEMKVEFTQLELSKYELLAKSYGCDTPEALSVFVGDVVWQLADLKK